MAGISGGQAYVAAAKQSAKGTAATAAKYAWPFAGGNLQPRRQIERLQETDSNRDVGTAYVSQSGLEGSPEVYVRDKSIGLLLAAVLGASADSGSTNFTHTITPANALSYFTFWRGIGGVLFEKFQDVMVSDLVIRSTAGSPLTAAATLQGLTPTRLTSDPMPAWTGPPVVTLENGTVYTQNDMAVTLGGGATSLISSFELTISNNVNVQQTDDVVPFDLAPGQREVSLAFDMIFQTLDEYNKFHYGTAVGTTVVPTLYTTSLDFQFDKGVNNQVKFTIPVASYEEFPVEPQPDGSPVVVSVRAQAERSGSNILTAVVKNQEATAQ